ncbi:hypothetical protein [Nocardioides sp.]|uniref:hypothetical protein n=1 Tax=Nocardioides sp. TaxID=35761 RepID=UPI002617B352|nr:hypothetical protein [Nocardioides sp.]MCW2736529.1 hypothetical protein [Nocardioides sp.]
MTSASTPVARLVLVAGAVLVALGEVPRLVEPDRIAWTVPLDAFFHSSAVGGTLVLTGLAFVATTALLTARGAGRTAPLFTLVSILAPLWILQVVVLGAVMVARTLDTLAPPSNLTGGVWSSVLTFRWNFWITDNMLAIPAELLGLALLSIAAQLLVLVAAAVVVLPSRWNRVVLGWAAVLAAVVVVALRVRVVGAQDPYVLLLDTFARSDAFFLGVAVACAVGSGRRVGPSASNAALVVIVGAVLASGFVSTEQQLVLQLPVTALLASFALLDPGVDVGDWILEHAMRSRGVELLAPMWAPVLVCTTPAAVIIGRRTEMHWVLRVIVLLIVLAIVVRVARSVAGRVRLPQGPIGLTSLADTWRRVVAEADAEVRDGRRARPSRSGDDEIGGRGAG